VRERQVRLKAIKKIIQTTKIDSQERLLDHLADEGFTVTQATLSRDLKLLKVGKQAEGSDGYFYTLPTEEMRREQERSFVQDFLRGYVSLDFAGNIAVVRTLNGHADSVAVAIDSLNMTCVLGTVAGGDTVMVAIRESCSRDDFIGCLQERIPDFEY